MDIEVGEYVRTKDGYIAKYIGQEKNYGYDGYHYRFDSLIRDIRYEEIEDEDSLYPTEIGQIAKHSKNIIDILEVGDIVDISSDRLEYGRAIIALIHEELLNRFKLDLSGRVMKLNSILTHERYEANCYILENKYDK